ncbi:MAG: winged helix-turn-helix domain-containing protein [Sandaracinaceae bacterium]|nr:MAG: winged helix-turn-helix domain-containing protein [Sandaracinaceae bacterium]
MRTLSKDDARRFLLRHLGLDRWRRGARGIRATLEALGCIQLDPLDAIGTNADLVTLARVDGVRRGDVYDALLPRHAFEHFAKERCLVPARAFPQYRDRAIATPWWRLHARSERVPRSVLEAVYEEVARHGPKSAAELSDHGAVEALDWSGWKGTSRMTTMALEILWTRCRVVVSGRASDGAKRYDLPSRALPDHHDAPAAEYGPWALRERVASAGLLARAVGPSWSMLRDVRHTLTEAMLAEGAVEAVTVEGSSRPYLAPAGLSIPRRLKDDGRMRVLGPLDPLLWDRKLVRQIFGFDYVWEVYKPASARRWGWYVCPLLHRGELVGRVEAKISGDTLVVQRLWREEGVDFDEDAFDRALERHAEACRATAVKRLRAARRR